MMYGQKKGLCSFKLLFFLKVPWVIYEKLPFLSNKPCFQVWTVRDFEMILKKSQQ